MSLHVAWRDDGAARLTAAWFRWLKRNWKKLRSFGRLIAASVVVADITRFFAAQKILSDGIATRDPWG